VLHQGLVALLVLAVLAAAWAWRRGSWRGVAVLPAVRSAILAAADPTGRLLIAGFGIM
jgi:hypothetical protein